MYTDAIPFTVLSSSHQVDWFGVALQRGLAKGFSPTHPLQVSAAQVDGVVSASYAGEEHAGEEQAGGVASGGDPQPLYTLKCEVVRIDDGKNKPGGNLSLAKGWPIQKRSVDTVQCGLMDQISSYFRDRRRLWWDRVGRLEDEDGSIALSSANVFCSSRASWMAKLLFSFSYPSCWNGRSRIEGGRVSLNYLSGFGLRRPVRPTICGTYCQQARTAFHLTNCGTAINQTSAIFERLDV